MIMKENYRKQWTIHEMLRKDMILMVLVMTNCLNIESLMKLSHQFIKWN